MKLTLNIAKANIEKLYRQASMKNVTDGLNWYPLARAYCVDLAEKHDIAYEQVVACLAVLSPNCSWDTNKLAVKLLLETGACENCNVYPDNIEKAYRIAFKGVDPLEILGKPNRYGNKVRAFYNNIRDPRQSVSVTIDTHAIRAAYGRYDVTLPELRQVFESVRGYKLVQQAYQEVAAQHGMLPCSLQAIVWLTVKEMYA